ncbi:MAG: peptidyl-prolyl cis-trans isomerase [Phycisphaerae bacterium]|nr:peptidyl-prolyl cis-trans isomerase [Phycisphaerae bacterium]
MRNVRTIWLLILLAVTAAGCGSRRPTWLGGRREPDVIQPRSTTPPSKPTSAPADTPAPRQPPSGGAGSAVGEAPDAAQTLSQAEPTLLGETDASDNDKPLSLTDLESLGGDLPWEGARPETLSEQLARNETKDDSRDKKDESKGGFQPRLAPLPEEEKLAEVEAQTPKKPARRAPRVEYESAPPDGSPDDLRSRMTGEEPPAAATDARPPAAAEEEETPPAPETPDKPFVEGQEEVVAGMTLQINDQNVTVDEILSALHKELSAIPKHVSRDKFRTMAAEIITRQMWAEARSILMFAEAKRRLEDHVKEKIQEEVADVKRELLADVDGSIEMLKEKFRREGTTLEDAMNEHERDITTRYYMQIKFFPAIVVNRRMLWNYYRKHKTDFVVEREVQMQIIAAPFRRFLPEGVTHPTEEELAVATAAARDAVAKAQADLKAGKDFGTVAKAYSRGLRAEKGGVWPMMGAGNFRNTRVEKEAFTLPEGKCSEIIEGKDGFYIVKALKVKPGKITPFLDAQDPIEIILRNEQYDKLSREYMNKLYENAVIHSPPDFIPTAVERALERYKGPS